MSLLVDIVRQDSHRAVAEDGVPPAGMGAAESLITEEAGSIRQRRPSLGGKAVSIPIEALEVAVIVAAVGSAVRFVLVRVHVFLANEIRIAGAVADLLKLDLRSGEVDAALRCNRGVLADVARSVGLQADGNPFEEHRSVVARPFIVLGRLGRVESFQLMRAAFHVVAGVGGVVAARHLGHHVGIDRLPT